MAKDNLKINWSEFDNKRIRGKRDANKFSCEEPWEVNYLIKAIHGPMSRSLRARIRNAIIACCKEAGTPRSRDQFVRSVILKALRSLTRKIRG